MAPFTVTDIFNRPPSIAEDTLQYTIYPPPNLTDKASVTTFAACFQSFAETLLSEFIWHRDAFELKVVPNPEDDGAWILEGRMRVGDCVDDEWCVVWLLREISSKWDVVIGVYDSDGEFLLIEGAEALPSWVQPSNSENRVRALPSYFFEATKDALRNNPDYLAYVENLVSAGYFQGEVEGSELWKILENKAAATFVEVRRSDGATRQSFARQVDSAIANVSELPLQETVVEDSDAWLNIDEADFDSMLARGQGKAQKSDKGVKGVKGEQMDVDDQTEDDMATFQANQLKALASKVEDFIEGEGDIEGAQFQDEKLSDDEDLSDFSDSDNESSGDERMEDDSLPAMTAAERQAAMDKLVAPLEQSDYGKMPASYSKSQKLKPTTIDNDVVEDVSSKEKTQAPKPENESPRRIRAPIIPRNQYDGVDSDDETDEEEVDEEDEEDNPQVIGDVEIDMDEEEEEFLEFSRQALGISDEQWNDIIKDRKARGAFLPASATKPKNTASKASVPTESTETPTAKAAAGKTPRVPQPGPRPNANPELDSFEAVMQALDQELAKARPQKSHGAQSKGSAKNKGKQKETEPAGEDFDIDAIMEDELRAVLERDDSDEEMERDSAMEYNLIKNFLESFKSQGGLSVNTSGLARLTKFYTPLHQSAENVVQKIFSLISARPASLCNFLDAPELEAFLGPKGGLTDERWRVVYRNYATLYFVFVVDSSESELGILDLIQVFVESLDRAFENVCELDLVFHFDEVHHILAEVIQGGLVLETNVDEIDSCVQQASRARKESFASSNPLSLGGSGLNSRGGNLKTPLGWLTGKLTGVGAR
ncbi:hypothetical protein MD484_g79, partial [Candolleomyces efflorescens]